MYEESSTATLPVGNKKFKKRVICQIKVFPFLLFPLVIIINQEIQSF